MLIAAALWSKWHFPASTEPEGAARAGASGNGNAARLLICLGQPTVPYLAPITGSGVGRGCMEWDAGNRYMGVAHVSPSPMFVANVCGFEFKLK